MTATSATNLPPVSRQPRVAAIVGLVFILTWLFRWLTMNAPGGDDHWSLWTASAFLKGDSPFREFTDPGDPLYWGMSALAQAVVGYRILGEILLGATLTAVGLTLGFRMAWLASRSLGIATALTVVATLLISTTKLYSYPKIFVYPLGLWLAWRYIDRPSRWRAVMLAAGVAVAWGYRHDHGAYMAVGASAAVVAAHWRQGPRAVALSLCQVGIATIAVLSPYLLLIQAREGVFSYFQERIGFAAGLTEAGRRSVNFVIDDSAPAWFAIATPPPAVVGVRWRDEASPEKRRELERRFALSPPPPSTSNERDYFATDTSAENLTGLLGDAHVAGVKGVQALVSDGFAADAINDGIAPVDVRWHDRVTADRRGALERRYQLEQGILDARDSTGQSRRYRIRDSSVQNITALHKDGDVLTVAGTHAVKIPTSGFVLPQRPDLGPDVLVRWAPTVTDAERARLEKQYGLVYGHIDSDDPTQSVWQYQIVDQSTANVTALATDTRVVYKDQIGAGTEPGTFAVRPWKPLPGVAILVSWHPGIAEPERADLERRYHLLPRSQVPDDFVAYQLGDPREATLVALADEHSILDTTGFERSTGRLNSDTWFTAQKRRFPWLTASLFPRVLHRDNAGVWLHYLSYALPFVVMATLLVDRLRRRQAPAIETRWMIAVAVMMAVANLALLKQLGYFADHFDMTMVMAAWLLGRAFGGSWRTAGGAVAAATAVGVVAISAVSVAAYTRLPELADTYKIDGRVWQSSVDRFTAFATSPPIDGYAPADATGDKALIRYLYECTRPDDRIWVTTDNYAIPYYTERRVVGHVFWSNGFMRSEAYQRQTIDLLEREQVPIIFGIAGDSGLSHLAKYDLIRDYVARRYTQEIKVLQDNSTGGAIWLLIDSRRAPSGNHERLNLPCFR
jgi:hypothetical protein